MNISENGNKSEAALPARPTNRARVLALLQTKGAGMTSRDVAKALDMPVNVVVHALRGLRDEGHVAFRGQRGSRLSRWCLPGQEMAAVKAFRRAQVMFQKRQQAARDLATRLRRVKQRTKPAIAPRQFKLPKVNSVWSLAA